MKTSSKFAIVGVLVMLALSTFAVLYSPVQLKAQSPSGNCALNFGAPPAFIVTTSGFFGCLIPPNSNASVATWQQLWPVLQSNGGGASDFMLSTSGSLSNAQVLGMNATPVTLVAAQGAGTLIEPISIVLESVNGGTVYASGGAIGLDLNNAGTLTAVSGTVAATFLTSPIVTQNVMLLGLMGSATAANTLNQPLVITNATGAFTTGTGTINYQLKYRVHTGL